MFTNNVFCSFPSAFDPLLDFSVLTSSSTSSSSSRTDVCVYKTTNSDATALGLASNLSFSPESRGEEELFFSFVFWSFFVHLLSVSAATSPSVLGGRRSLIFGASKLSDMSSSAPQFVISRRMMGFYEPNHQIGRWESSMSTKTDDNQFVVSPTSIDEEDKIDIRLEDDVSQETVNPVKRFDQESSRRNEKVLRRLAQNREAARKSRLRKKAYVQQLESSRIKLSQLENELESARQQGALNSLSAVVNSDIASFEMEYAHWVEDQNRQICELRSALQQHVSDIELQMLVENGMRHYAKLFQIKAAATKADVFYVMSGMWKTPAERCFLWIGGFRPSELLKVLSPQLDPLTEQQRFSIYNLQKLSQQAEDALSQGMDKLQQTLSETLATNPLTSSGVEHYMGQMSVAIGKLEDLESFVNQADHLRQQALHQVHRILTTRQAARALLLLGDYVQRLRALSSLWAARPHEPA